MSLQQRGFTLLEVLAALAIFAIMGAMAYGGLTAMARNQQLLNSETQRFGGLALAMSLIERDVRSAVPRPVRDEFGDAEPAIRGRSGLLQLTRAGWNNPTGAARSRLQRIRYDFDGGQLLRISWPVLDRSQATRPDQQALLTGVSAMAVQFLPEAGADWTAAWPPPGSVAERAPWPRAVRIDIEGDFGRVERVFSLAAESSSP